jgi:hypothetical protein
MIETTIQNPEKHETLTADSQGRVSLGIEYAAHDVEIVVVDSEEHEPDEDSLQQTIGDRPMNEHERKGMLFVRSFGISRRFLKDDHTAETTEDGNVEADSVAPIDVNWSYGFLHDPGNVARFEFDTGAGDGQFSYTDKLTAEPAGVTTDENEGDPVYRYENDAGEASAIAQELAEKVGQMFGYDPAEDLSNVRVDPDEAPTPVMFRDPESDTYVAIAPRVNE